MDQLYNVYVHWTTVNGSKRWRMFHDSKVSYPKQKVTTSILASTIWCPVFCPHWPEGEHRKKSVLEALSASSRISCLCCLWWILRKHLLRRQSSFFKRISYTWCAWWILRKHILGRKSYNSICGIYQTVTFNTQNPILTFKLVKVSICHKPLFLLCLSWLETTRYSLN